MMTKMSSDKQKELLFPEFSQIQKLVCLLPRQAHQLKMTPEQAYELVQKIISQMTKKCHQQASFQILKNLCTNLDVQKSVRCIEEMNQKKGNAVFTN